MPRKSSKEFITWAEVETPLIAAAEKSAASSTKKTVASWFVYDMPNQSSRRSANSRVRLAKGQVARVRVELPPSLRGKVAFTLIHDKRRAADRARTKAIQHGHTVHGNSHDWPGFGDRIYIGRVLYPQGQKELWKLIVGFRVYLDVV